MDGKKKKYPCVSKKKNRTRVEVMKRNRLISSTTTTTRQPMSNITNTCPENEVLPCDRKNEPESSAESPETKDQGAANNPKNENSVIKKGRKRKACSGLPFRTVKYKRQSSARGNDDCFDFDVEREDMCHKKEDYELEGRRIVVFAVWTGINQPMKVEYIERDEQFWKTKMLPPLTKFFYNCLLPELIDPRIERSMPIKDPPYIMAAIEKKKQQRSQKQSPLGN